MLGAGEGGHGVSLVKGYEVSVIQEEQVQEISCTTVSVVNNTVLCM